MQSPAALTSIVIVAADSGDDLGACVASVLASDASIEVIVSDNASRDGSIQKLQSRWTGEARLRILCNGTNLGFGAGCNRGAALASGDALLFLNPDCRIEPDTVSRLRAHLDDSTGLLGAAIVDARGKPESASRRRDPILRRVFTTATGLDRWQARWPALAGINRPAVAAPADADVVGAEVVDAVSGALLLLPRRVFDQVHGFDEDYFLHFEDLDLCRRVRDAGLRVVCVNAVPVVHIKGTSSRARPFLVAFHKHRGLWRWFVKFDPAARHALVRGLVWCGVWASFVLSTPRCAWRWCATRKRANG